jgi:hypothetical protein
MPVPRLVVASAVLGAGLTLGWLSSGRLLAVAALATGVAAVNGYSKAYSP